MKIPEFKLERYFAKYEFNTPYLLSSSDCESMSIRKLISHDPESITNFMDLTLGYTESLGNPELREEIGKLYTTALKEDIMVFSGAEEGIYCFMNAILQEDDEIIVQFPGYQSLFEVANSIGAKVHRWEMKENKDWNLDLGALRRKITNNTKAIVINNPHNPTGQIMKRNDYIQLLTIAKENDIYLFSDEVYRFTEFDERDALLPAVDLYEKAISLGVMSKSFGLPGLRIGWIATRDHELFDKIAKFKDYTTICNSAPAEYLATVALQNKDEILKESNSIIDQNIQILDIFFDKYNTHFSWIKPRGGSVGFVKINKNIFESAAKFCLDLIDKEGVLLVPGLIFDFDDYHFRIGFGRKNMYEALERLISFIEKIRN
ncbi:MAG: aminotransferase class I/II-fold pyridoxal phosphate-dependent enzyme [Candidatus Heimdallarchaeota archaeon]|nr:aminotransferase class I/II-fold pyridoxal phosphate-dependent enzyme [Candidatus Heimdallarchaeota archaeon]